MAFKKGHTKVANSGRVKGQQNKVNQDVRQRILETANKLDFEGWASENRTEFFKFLYSKIIPKELNITMQAWVRTLSDTELDEQIKRLSSEIDTQK